MRAPRLLIISQVYVPDPASVGQHLHDAAEGMIARGWQVRVLTSARGYDDPRLRYAKRENIAGVEVRRFGLSSLGKRFIVFRLAGAVVFLIQALAYGLFMRRIDCVLVSTSPPMCSLVGLTVSTVRGVPLKFWAMDINPDQLVAIGKISNRSMLVRAMDWLNRLTLRRAVDVVALDRFMVQRLSAKLPVPRNIRVIPPWPHVDGCAEAVASSDNPFRQRHGLRDKFVVMYSGNMSPVHPIDTILHAALQLRDDSELVFLFIGGGLAAAEVRAFKERHALENVQLLPYQPLSELRNSLSAGDLHVVTLGEAMVGVVHPCKIYGALAVGRPILAVGPRPSHLSDILDAYSVGWMVAHGDVGGVLNVLKQARNTPAAMAERGRLAQQVILQQFDRTRLRSQFCDVLAAGKPVVRY